MHKLQQQLVGVQSTLHCLFKMQCRFVEKKLKLVRFEHALDYLWPLMNMGEVQNWRSGPDSWFKLNASVKLNSPNCWKWTLIYKTEQWQQLKLVSLRKWTVDIVKLGGLLKQWSPRTSWSGTSSFERSLPWPSSFTNVYFRDRWLTRKW